jgi:hypothetical protein
MMRKHFFLPVVAAAVPGLILVACSTGSSPSTPASSTQAVATAQTVATQAAPTLQAARPTVQALSTTAANQIATAAPTLQAIATQFAPVSSTVTASEPVRMTAVQSSPTDSTVSIQNTSTTTVDVSNWRLQVGTASTALPSGVVVQPGQSVTLHAATGTSTPTDVYLGQTAQNVIANLKPGAQVMLQSPQGQTSAFTVPGA